MPATATTPSRGTVYLSSLGGRLFRTAYSFDGTTLTISVPTVSVQLDRGGGALALPDHRVVVVGAGLVSLYDPLAQTLDIASTTTNANTAVLDPNGTRLWTGWKDTPIAEVPLAPFGDGTAHLISGDDTVATTVAFTPSDGIFYSTGGEGESGNFGRIDLSTFVTTRVCTACFATIVTYDPFTGDLILAGLGRSEQRDPADPATLIASRDDSVLGENYLALQPTGDGHLIGTRSGSGGVVIIDYSASGRLDDASTVIAFAAAPTIGDLSGALAVDPELIFPSGFDGP
jgi:hypothetical protein